MDAIQRSNPERERPLHPVSNIRSLLSREVAQAARVPVGAIARDKPLLSLGLDSLAVVELQHELEQTFGVSIPIDEILDGLDLAGLEDLVIAALEEEGRALESIAAAPGGVEERPLSPGQLALWLLQQVAAESGPLHIAAAARVRAEGGRRLDATALGYALAALAERHPILLATFEERDGEPIQRFGSGQAPELVEVDAAAWSDEELDAWSEREAYRPFDLAAGPLMRLSLARRADGDDAVVLAIHHLVADFWSVAVLVRDLSALYLGKPLPPLPLTYGDYLGWQAERLGSAQAARLWAYWREQLSPWPASLALPSDRPRPAVPSYRGGAVSLSLGPALSADLAALARRGGTTPFVTLLAGFQAFLGRCSGQRDLVVGSPAAGRGRRELAGLAGYFVNMMALRADLSANPGFLAFLSQARGRVRGALEHQELPLLWLTERLPPREDSSDASLLQACFVLQKAQAAVDAGLAAFAVGARHAQLDFGGLALESWELPVRWSQFDLVLFVAEVDGSLAASLQFSADLFDPTTAGRMLGHLRELLAGVAAEPGQPLSTLPWLAAAERHQLLAEWNDRAVGPDRGPWIHERFAEQARRRPEASAVVDGARWVSYGELDRWARRIARALRGLGVQPEVRVAVCLERSPEQIAACIGVLQAGGAYVAFDPSHPEERLGFQLADAQAPVLLTRRGSLADLAASRGVRCLFPHELAQGGPADRDGLAELAAPVLQLGNLAYVLYTSGSTGRPKGVELTHGSLLNLVALHGRLLGIGAADHTTLLAGEGFDATILEIWTHLAAGASLHVTPQALRTSPEELLVWMTEQGITTSFLPTALAEAILDLGWGPGGPPRPALRSVLTGGDRLHRFVPESLPFELTNIYGPTETTVMATTGMVPAGERPGRPGQAPAIGGPLENVRVHVVDRAEWEPRLAPAGVPGELLIGGAGLARDYLRRPGLTAQSFVPDPFGTAGGERLYRTGDLVRWSPGGELEFLGRLDHQVKLRGQRIELGEIETVLALHPAVREAAVLALDGRLVAFVASGGAEEPAVPELREHARRQLPEYMVPAAFVPLAALPLNTSGKVDRLALAELGRQAAPAGDAEPGPVLSPVQELLADIWRELLGVEHVRLGDSFFELGGHSLTVAQLRSRVRTAFAVDLPPQSFFEAQTLESQTERIAETLREASGPAGPPIVPEERDGDPILSFAQQRLWFLDQLAPGTQLYNIPLVANLRGELDLAALERSLGEIVRRHEALRTTFPETAAGAVQRIAPPGDVPPPLPLIDASGLPPAAREREIERLTLASARRPFDLARGPLLRNTLLRAGEREHVLLICMHHIVSDGWSTGVIVRELSAFYRGFTAGVPMALPAPPIQYADFALWQRRWFTGQVYEQQMAYWRDQLAGLSAVELPTDRPRPPVETFHGTFLPAVLPAVLTGSLRELARGTGTTLYMVLLAAFDVLVSAYTGRQDVGVGAVVANRNRREIEDVVGFFVNTLVMRTSLAGTPSLRELLGRVRETTLASYVHEDLPFEKLVEELQPERDLSRNPLFQVMLVLQNAPLPPLDLPGLAVSPRHVDLGTVKFDMALVWEEEDGRLVGQLEHSTVLFDATTMQRLLGHYAAVLAQAAADPDLPIAALGVLTEAERHQIAEEWNDTRIAFGPGRCVHEWVEEQVAATPGALALIAGDVRLDYRELNTMANRLAHHLRRLGIGPDVLVGICVDRTWAMVVGLLGVLKAGGGALALDPTYPEERLRYVIEDAGLALLLAEEKLLPLLPDTGIPRLRIDTDWPLIAAESDANPGCWSDPELTMYAIYTSGSTGLPKGVSFPHRAFVNLLAWQFDHSQLARRARTVQFATFGFCVSFLEIFSVLCTGGTLVMLKEEYRRDMEALWRHLEEHQVERLHLPFAALKQLADVCGEEDRVPRHLREVVTSGEQLQIGRSLRSLFSNLGRCSLHNQYGTSEIHVVSSFRLPGEPGEWPDIAPVGRPVANSQIYLLDAQFQPLPVGVLGELYAGGACVARGYLGAPAQTAAKFVPDPFAARRGEAGARLYATGDLARQLPDGRVEWFGRIDNQVRIRGFRVELGEVETALKQHLGVRNGAVLCRPGPGDTPRLIAYVVPREGDAMPEDLHAFLKAKLPEHMVPAVFVPMASLPLNANGKLDFETFPDPEVEVDEASFVAPRGPVEEMVAQIWARILGLPRVGAHDNFFKLGGHSLLATQLANRIRRNFAIELPLRTIFEGPTVAELAQAVVAREAKRGQSEKIARAFLKVLQLSETELSEQLRESRSSS